MKAKMSNDIFQSLLAHNWDAEDIVDIACGEFLFLYGEYDEVEVVEVTANYVKFRFYNQFARDVYLQIDDKGHIQEVKR